MRPENVRSALVHSGLGVTALAPNGDKVIVGSRAFLLKEKVSVAIADARATELEAQGRSVLLVALGGRLIGLLALQDGLRPGARAAVQRLHDARIEPVLLSGEARDTCETIARALDIEHVRPEILPADRGAEVRALADGGRVVAAIGHPSSDDGALGAADVSVAMTAAGAAPGEWGVALASDDVRDAALALTVPRACRERAKVAVLVGAAAQGVSLARHRVRRRAARARPGCGCACRRCRRSRWCASRPLSPPTALTPPTRRRVEARRSSSDRRSFCIDAPQRPHAGCRTDLSVRRPSDSRTIRAVRAGRCGLSARLLPNSCVLLTRGPISLLVSPPGSLECSGFPRVRVRSRRPVDSRLSPESGVVRGDGR